MRAPWRRTFDPERSFTVRRAMTVDGVKLAPGDIFDKKSVPTRRLRQLYDQRKIIFAGDIPGAIIPKRRKKERKPEAAAASADLLPARSAIEIPDGWRELPWPQRRALASSLTDGKVTNGPEAEAAVLAELARRGVA